MIHLICTIGVRWSEDSTMYFHMGNQSATWSREKTGQSQLAHTLRTPIEDHSFAHPDRTHVTSVQGQPILKPVAYTGNWNFQLHRYRKH